MRQKTIKGSLSRDGGSHFRLLPAAPLHCPITLTRARSMLPRAPSLLPLAPSLLPRAPSVLPLKRPCSLSRPGTAILDPKFGVYIIYIYAFGKNLSLRRCDETFPLLIGPHSLAPFLLNFCRSKAEKIWLTALYTDDFIP